MLCVIPSSLQIWLLGIGTKSAIMTLALPLENLPHIRFHDLHHLSGSILISEGVDALTVSRRLGHAQTSTTLNIYGHVLEGTDSTAADTLAKHISQ